MPARSCLTVVPREPSTELQYVTRSVEGASFIADPAEVHGALQDTVETYIHLDVIMTCIIVRILIGCNLVSI